MASDNIKKYLLKYKKPSFNKSKTNFCDNKNKSFNIII